MAMFCDLCEQTVNGYACRKNVICGEDEDTQSLQNILQLNPISNPDDDLKAMLEG